MTPVKKNLKRSEAFNVVDQGVSVGTGSVKMDSWSFIKSSSDDSVSL